MALLCIFLGFFLIYVYKVENLASVVFKMVQVRQQNFGVNLKIAGQMVKKMIEAVDNGMK